MSIVDLNFIAITVNQSLISIEIVVCVVAKFECKSADFPCVFFSLLQNIPTTYGFIGNFARTIKATTTKNSRSSSIKIESSRKQFAIYTPNGEWCRFG